MGLYPNMMYRLVPGLVALFGRASLHPSNPRTPLIRSCVASGFSYFAVAMHPAENGRVGGEVVICIGSWVRHQTMARARVRSSEEEVSHR
jgi:hypothetical protein